MKINSDAKEIFEKSRRALEYKEMGDGSSFVLKNLEDWRKTMMRNEQLEPDLDLKADSEDSFNKKVK